MTGCEQDEDRKMEMVEGEKTAPNSFRQINPIAELRESPWSARSFPRTISSIRPNC